MDCAGAAVHDLRKDTSLLDPEFTGYKLAGEAMSITTLPLQSPVRTAQLSAAQAISLLHLRSTGLFNHLSVNPWQHTTVSPMQQTVCYIDKQLRVVSLNIFDSQVAPCIKAQLYDGDDPGASDCDPSLVYASNELAVVTDGLGMLFVFQCKDHPWRELHRSWPFKKGTDSPHFAVVAAQEHAPHGISCVLHHIDHVPGGVARISLTHVQLTWGLNLLQLITAGMNAWTGSTVPELASVFEDGLHVLMVTKDLFQATGLPAEPATGGVPMDTSPEEDTTVATERALFSWQQEGLNIDLAIPIPANLTAKDVECIIQPTTLNVIVRGQATPLLAGTFIRRVLPDECIWTINESRGTLDIVLGKFEDEFWPSLLAEFPSEPASLTVAQVDEIRDRWAEWTSDKPNAAPGEATAYHRPRDQQLEECDFQEDEAMSIFRYSTETGALTNVTRMSGMRWLFSTKLADTPKLDYLAVQADVDALLFRLDDNGHDVHHSTFHAFGYVQASKSNRKFLLCSPDAKLTFIIECTTRVYAYAPGTGKAGLLSLPSCADVVGAVALSDGLVVLTPTAAYLVMCPSLLD